MASLRGFGQQLRDARVSHGLTYGTVSRKLRIRHDIIQAIEEEDFATMPPRSYARGMIHAYASLLGLNADRLVDDYMRAVEEYETSGGSSRRPRTYRPAQDKQMMAFDDQAPSEISSADAARERIRQRRARRAGVSPEEIPQQNSRGTSRRRDDRRANSKPNNSTTKQVGTALEAAGSVFTGAAGAVANAVGGAVSTHRNVDINHSIYADKPRSGGFRQGIGGQKVQYMGNSHHTIMSTRNFDINANNQGGSKLPFIIGVVVLLVILIIAANVLFNKPAQTSTNVSNTSSSSSASVAISGLTDPGSAGTVEQEIKVIPIAPTAAVFTYEIADGEDCYLEIYIDESSTPDVATVYTGPKKGTYDVTGTLTFVTSRPGVVTLKLDGKAVELEDENGNGIYEYHVDFSEILAAWKEENGL